MTSQPVKLTLLLRPGLDLPPEETLWATPLGGPHYRLLMSSFYVPLSVGDVVTAHLDPYQRHTITAVAEPSLEIFAMARNTATVDHGQARSLTARWRSRGAVWAEHSADSVNSAWSQNVEPDNVYSIMSKDLDPQDGWGDPRVYSPEARTTDALNAWARIA